MSAIRRLWVALGITVAVLAAQLVGSWLTGSLALLTDTGHMTTDAIGLVVALVAATLSRRPPDDRRSWGLRRMEVVGATVQAVLLLGVAAFVIVEAIRRFGEQPVIPAAELLVFASVGLVGNIAAIAVLWRGRDRSLNLRAAFLEVLGDALGSVAVIAAAIVIAFTGWGAADTIAAILIGALIVPRAIALLWDGAKIVLEVTPKGVDLAAIRSRIEEVPHVRAVHDLHVSRISTDFAALTAHVVVDDACFREGCAPRLLDDLNVCVAETCPLAADHATFQLEPASAEASGHTAH